VERPAYWRPAAADRAAAAAAVRPHGYSPRMDYPHAPRLEVVDVLHGVEVADPYRWLEAPDAPETRAWSASQDALARAWLDALPGRGRLRDRLQQLVAAGTVSVPVLRGGRAFLLRRRAEQEHAVLLVREADGTERTLVDPSTLSAEDTVTLDGWVPSVEGRLVAYWTSDRGDEEASLWVLDVDTGEVVDGPIDRTRYCPLAWLPGGEEFLYGRRLAADQVPAGEDRFHRRVWRHRLGTDPAGDELVFGEGRDKTEYHALDVSRDGRWLVIGGWLGTAPRNDLYIADLAGDAALRPVQEGTDAETWGGVEDDGLLWLRTNQDAPRFRVVVADPARPEPERWREVVGESEAVLEGFALTDDAVVVAGIRHAVGRVTVHDRADGRLRGEVALPEPGAVAGVTTRPEGGDEAWIGYTDFTTPARVYRYSTSARTLEVWARAPGEVEVKGVTATQETYRSADGTQVRMFVLRGEDTPADGGRPAVLTGYGGFNIPLCPAYAPQMIAWVEGGGVWAVANLRGGSEEGETWHRAGMREHKQNVFDDFHAAAEHLVASGSSRRDGLGIVGGSNGGLLVGAALTQRPELYRAVVCSAPLLDMIRYERFGLGETWNDEYGRADDPVEFRWLLSYSPYHHVRPGTAYPAVLFTVFGSDTRVDPMHARKLCAALQWATSSPEPVLLRRELDVGHGARSVSRTIDLQVDVLAFLADRLGLER
jgi:prolyl oligopeptidase